MIRKIIVVIFGALLAAKAPATVIIDQEYTVGPFFDSYFLGSVQIGQPAGGALAGAEVTVGFREVYPYAAGQPVDASVGADLQVRYYAPGEFETGHGVPTILAEVNYAPSLQPVFTDRLNYLFTYTVPEDKLQFYQTIMPQEGTLTLNLNFGLAIPNAKDDDASYPFIRVRYFYALPEPSTWAIAIIGFGVIGLTMRRRREASSGSGIASADHRPCF